MSRESFPGSAVASERQARSALDGLARGVRRATEEDIEINDVRRLYLKGANGLLYQMKAAVTPTITITAPDGTTTSMLPVIPEPAYYGPNSFAFLPAAGGFAALTAGDLGVVAGATINSGVSGDPNGAGFSYDLPLFVGGAWFGSLVGSRVELHVYGTVTGFEFNAQPYVGAYKIYHEGNPPAPLVQTKTAGYSEAATNGRQVRLCNLAAGFTVVLPTAVGNTAVFTFKKLLAAGSIIIDGAGTETIDGALTLTLTAQYDKVSIVSDGANWWIV